MASPPNPKNGSGASRSSSNSSSSSSVSSHSTSLPSPTPEGEGKVTDFDRSIQRMMALYASEVAKPNYARSSEFQVRRNAAARPAFVSEAGVVTEGSEAVEVLDQGDIVVMGGGTGGAIAAWKAAAAARPGTRVVVVEKSSCFGGIMTGTMETGPWYQNDGVLEEQGVIHELMEIMRQTNKASAARQWAVPSSMVLDSQALKATLDALICGAGAQAYLECPIVNVIMDRQRRLRGVVVHTAGGKRMAVLGRYFLDATQGYLSGYLSGAAYRQAAGADAMGTSVTFSVRGVNRKRFEEYIKEADPDFRTYKAWDGPTWKQETTDRVRNMPSPYMKEIETNFEEGTASVGHGGTYSSFTGGVEDTDVIAFNLNLIHIKNLDPMDPRERTQTWITGRKSVAVVIERLRKVPGWEKAELLTVCDTLGVRQSRQAVCRKTWRGEEVTTEMPVEQSIGVLPVFVDGKGFLKIGVDGEVCEIPYGMMVVQEHDNVLAVGTNADMDPIAYAAGRNINPVVEAARRAAFIAVLALNTGKNFHSLTTQEIQDHLRQHNISIHKSELLAKMAARKKRDTEESGGVGVESGSPLQAKL